MTRILRFMLLLSLVGVLLACGNATPAAQNAPLAASPTAAVSISALPTAVGSAATTAIAVPTLPALEATAASQPSASTAALPEGLTPEGYHYLGRADAPATLVMYSDFL